MKVIRIEEYNGSDGGEPGHHVLIQMTEWTEQVCVDVFVQRMKGGGIYSEVSDSEESRHLRGSQKDEVRALAVEAVKNLGGF
jgi:hypothetical protein